MILTQQQQIEFDKASKPLMKYLASNHHPHVKVIVDSGSSEILESSRCLRTDEFIKD